VELWSWTLTAIGAFGLYMVGREKTWGWVVNLAAQPLWAVFAIVTQQYGFIVSSALYASVYGHNLLAQRRRDRRNDSLRESLRQAAENEGKIPRRYPRCDECGGAYIHFRHCSEEGTPIR
jgi:hypothetical protein